MEKKISYVVEVAKYDFREITQKEEDVLFELAQNGVDTYENFQIKGIYSTKTEAEKRFNALKDAQVKTWENDGTIAPHNLTMKNDGWAMFANTPNEYWICRDDNDIEYRIRIREYLR